MENKNLDTLKAELRLNFICDDPQVLPWATTNIISGAPICGAAKLILQRLYTISLDYEFKKFVGKTLIGSENSLQTFIIYRKEKLIQTSMTGEPHTYIYLPLFIS